ncbi:HNH endonuclease [Neobacillus drentensis]|uniref:phosphorothioated DNA-binding restriction endonuclease n=1 Tax=Neobacillus drentensis TaxID=220684 RepID=UPI001F3114A8|nr:HNH endonuclease [Neobacillus drentensis]ULT59592.1 HNH endonuclease [Neobacillus drentensis]
MNIEKIINDINHMNVNIHNGRPALKKPLLLLLIISKFEEGSFAENRINFIDVEKELSELIDNYGGRPSKGGTKAYQPFQYLNSSPFWNIHLPNGVTMTHSKDLPIKVIRDQDTFVILDEELFNNLKHSSKARAILANFILQKWWPETVQEELRNILSLPLDNLVKLQKNRNKEFSSLVLANFRYKCAFCGFSSGFNNYSFGVDGAHIKWFSQNGPDTIENGLSLCKFHHWAFDRGVMGVNPKTLELKVSKKFIGRDNFSIKFVEELNGKSLEPFKEIEPNSIYLEWHNDFIFIG